MDEDGKTGLILKNRSSNSLFPLFECVMKYFDLAREVSFLVFIYILEILVLIFFP